LTKFAQVPSIEMAEEKTAARIASVDIFRGLTMVVMIFVNELAAVRGLPWWTYHATADVNVMTYVDMVYPFFLFIVGLSMPLAIQQRLNKNPSIPALWLHVSVRAASLMVLGLILANAHASDKMRTSINSYVWALLALTGSALFLNAYGVSERNAALHRWLRGFGLVLVVAMFAIFRSSTAQGDGSWIGLTNPDILGQIGFTYLVVAILYIPTRRWLWAPFAWFAALIAFNVLTVARWVTVPLPEYFRLCSNGSLAAMTMAGIATSVIYFGAYLRKSLRVRIQFGLAVGLLTLTAGWFLIPLGISKLRRTPTWSLFSIGAAILLFTALHFICDVKRRTAWAKFAHSASTNTLTTYLIPDVWAYILGAAGIIYFGKHLNMGWPGAVWAAVFTAIVVAIATVLTRLRVRLRL